MDQAHPLKITTRQLPPVNFVEGDDITVNCNPDVLGLNSSVTRIAYLLLQHVGDDPKSSAKSMMFVQQKANILGAKRDKGPEFHLWNFQTPDAADLDVELADRDNRGWMSIRATKKRAKCRDSGDFKCTAEYVFHSKVGTTAVLTPYIGTGTISIQDLVVFSEGVIGENTFAEGSLLTAECHAEGPENYEFRWLRSRRSVRAGSDHDNNHNDAAPATGHFVPWPNPEEIHTKASSLKLNDRTCKTYRQSQKLKFKATLEDSQIELRCRFGSEQTGFDTYSTTKTILVKKRPKVQEVFAPTDKHKSDDGSSNSLGTGIGIGVGLLFLLLVIAALIYVFLIRKRKNKSNDDAQHTTNANNMSSNAPPPVFYSKPNRHARSGRYDVRRVSLGSEDGHPYDKYLRRKPYHYYYYDCDYDHDAVNPDPDAYPRDVAQPVPRSGRGRRCSRSSNRRGGRGDSSVDDDDPDRDRAAGFCYSCDERRRRHGEEDDPGHAHPGDNGHRRARHAGTAASRRGEEEDEIPDADGRPTASKRRNEYGGPLDDDDDDEKEEDKEDKEEEEEKVLLQYADLELPQRPATGIGDGDGRDERDEIGREAPIPYASIWE